MLSSTSSFLPMMPPLDGAPFTRCRQGKQTSLNILLKPRPLMNSVHHATQALPSPSGSEAEDFAQQLTRQNMPSEHHICSTPTVSKHNDSIADTPDTSNLPLLPPFPALSIADATRARPVVTLKPRFRFQSPAVVDSAKSIAIRVDVKTDSSPDVEEPISPNPKLLFATPTPRRTREL